MTLSVCKPYRLGEGPPASNRPPPRTSIQHGRGPRGSLTPYNGAPPANVPPQPTIKRHAPRRQLHISARPTHARRPPTILPQPPPKKPISTPTTTPPSTYRPSAHAAPLKDPDTSPFPPPPPNPYPTPMNTAHTTTKKAPAQRTTRPRLLPPNAHQRSHTKPTRIRSNESYLKTPFSARTRFPKKHFNESNRNESHPRARRLPPKTAPEAA